LMAASLIGIVVSAQRLRRNGRGDALRASGATLPVTRAKSLREQLICA